MYIKVLSRGLVAVVGCIAFASSASDAFAQQNSLFGASGVSGGASGVSSGAVGSTAFPTSKFPGAGSVAGAGQLTGTGAGALPGMGATGQQTGGLIGQSTGNLIGTGAPAGMQQPGQTGQFGQMGNRQGQPNRNNANRRAGQNRNQGNQAGTAGAANQQKTTVRPQLLVAFDYPHPDAEQNRTSIATRFSKLAGSEFKGVQVETDGDVIVLRGEVDSARTGRMAAIFARMEPGVKNVRNELTVTEPSPSPSPSPASLTPATE